MECYGGITTGQEAAQPLTGGTQGDPVMKAPHGKLPIRRVIGGVLCGLPLALTLACVFWIRALPPATVAMGGVLATIAVLIGCLNLYLAYLRPWRYRRQRGSLEGYRYVSGLPLVGTLFQVAGCLIAFGSPTVGFIGGLAGLLDVGGVPWIPVLTWQDRSLWGD